MTEGEAIYDRIVSKIKEKSLNRLDLCQYANISSQAITNLKKQNSIPRADTAIKIAAYLNVSVEYLITGKESGLTNEQRELIRMYDKLDSRDKRTVVNLIVAMLRKGG